MAAARPGTQGCRRPANLLRRGGRVVECAALEMRFTGNRNVGSNPTLSAIHRRLPHTIAYAPPITACPPCEIARRRFYASARYVLKFSDVSFRRLPWIASMSAWSSKPPLEERHVASIFKLPAGSVAIITNALVAGVGSRTARQDSMHAMRLLHDPRRKTGVCAQADHLKVEATPLDHRP